jgi:hypothetical protein
MKTCLNRCAVTVLSLMLISTLSGCLPLIRGKGDFHITGNQLRRGSSSFHLKAFQAPGLLAEGPVLSAMGPAMARVAECGGNTVCFDLTGFGADGSSLDPASVETIAAYAERADTRRMAAMVRLPGAIDDPKIRREAIKTAARALKDEARVVYWIDGPDAPELAKLFKKRAPNLVVIATANGDIEAIPEVPGEMPERLAILVDAIPDFAVGDIHFVLSGSDEDYAALDRALMDPVELEPWTPDNSVLSEEEREEGFIALFDGKTLDGWWMKGSNKNSFHVAEEGFIEWLSSGGGALMTRDRYDNFILRLDWKLLPGGNSGVWVRAPRGARESYLGFEVQMLGDSTTEELTDDSTGAIYKVVPPTEMTAKPEGQWNKLEVICDGPLVKVTLNGVVIQDLDFDENEELKYRLRNGFICLTDHSDYVAFRNIRLKKL